jgi:secernin
MCDTMIATPDITADGVMLFAKNSDRDPNEAHHLLNLSAETHTPGSMLTCTYIDIPQVEHTYAVLLAKPYWIWGAEIGANEHGVVIGNEAIFSKVPASKEPRLIGMDLLRLGLERGANARQAVDVIVELLDQFGQGGDCGHSHHLYYHNSYLIADPREAWVLETVDRHWAAKRVSGVYTISNVLTIGGDFDLASPDLVNFAVEKGWCKSRDDFDFSRCYSDFLYTRFSDSRYRRQCSFHTLSARKHMLTPGDLMQTLRTHDPTDADNWRPDRGITGLTVCYHAGLGPVRADQSTGSMVSHLHPDHPTHFVTGTAAPCTSLFKPLWLDTPLPDIGPQPNGTYDPATLFWRHEQLHRSTLINYPARHPLYQTEREQLEKGFTTQALELAGEPADRRADFSAQCFSQADQAEKTWLERVAAAPGGEKMTWHYRRAWKQLNEKAKLTVQ